MKKKDKQEASSKDFDTSHLSYLDYENEIDQKEFAMFWEGLDLDNWINVLKVFAIRFAYIMVFVTEKRHPDEIHQGKEIAYSLIYS